MKTACFAMNGRFEGINHYDSIIIAVQVDTADCVQ